MLFQLHRTRVVQKALPITLNEATYQVWLVSHTIRAGLSIVDLTVRMSCRLQPVAIVSVTRCPETIHDGSLLGTCEREIGKTCDFSCDVGFSKTADQTTCTIHEVWHAGTDGLCKRMYK